MDTGTRNYLTVTAGYLWHVLWIWLEVTTTATVGDRQIVVQLQDGAADVIGEFRARITQAASLTYNYMFGPSLAQDLAIYDTNFLTVPLVPGLILQAGQVIRVYDNNNVDADDDIIIQMQVGTWELPA